jgi:hypothetical protein
MLRTYRSLAALLVFAAPALCAQAPAGPPPPGPEHKRIEYFAGRWTSVGDFKPGPMGPGGKMEARSVCEWFSGGFYLVCHYDGTMAGAPMKGLGIMGYHSERKRHTYYGIDNFGMPADVAYATPTADTWPWEGESTMGGQPVKGRYTIKVVSPDEYTWRWEMQMGSGPWTLIGEGVDKRVK